MVSDIPVGYLVPGCDGAPWGVTPRAQSGFLLDANLENVYVMIYHIDKT